MKCPDAGVLVELVRNGISTPDSDVITQHLEGCDECQRQIESCFADGALLGLDSGVSSPDNGLQVAREWKTTHCLRIARNVRTSVDSRAGSEFLLPFLFGDYELLRVIGEGGMGVVYLARQHSLNRDVVVKVVSQGRFATRSFINRFILEAESAARLDHPGIVPVFESGEVAGQVYYAMGYVAGGNLADRLTEGPLPGKDAAACLASIARAIEYAHNNGVIHRDLKPANILMDGDENPRVADFGLAKQIDSAASLTVTGEVLGTPSYMPPEQARMTAQEITVAGDVYSLGAILFHMLTGRPPFVAAEPVDVLHQLIHDDPISPDKLNPSVNRELQTIALKCLAKTPSMRYDSAAELAAELERFLDGRPILAKPMNRVERLSRWCRRNQLVAVLSVSLLGILVASTIVSSWLGYLANSRSGELLISNNDLSIAKGQAQDAAKRATTQAAIATKQATAAVRILESILFDLQPPLKADAAAQSLRREMLVNVLDELNQLPKGLVTTDRILRCQAFAMASLGDVAAQAGDEDGIAASAGAAKIYQDAIAIFEDLCTRHPNDPQAVGDLASAHDDLGNLYADDHQWNEARQAFLRAMELQNRRVSMIPYTPDDAVVLGGIEVAAGEAHCYLKEKERGEKWMRRGYERLKEARNFIPKDRRVREEIGVACLQLGKLNMNARRFDEAKAFFEELRDVSHDLASEYPLDYDTLMDHSTAYEYLGVLCLRQGRVREACLHHEESLRLCIDLGTAAPENDQIQWDVSFGFQHLADAYLAAGDLKLSEKNAKVCIEMRSRLVENGPTLTHRRVKLNHVLSTLARTLAAQQRYHDSADCYRLAAENLRQYSDLTGSDRFSNQIATLQQQHQNMLERIHVSSD